MPNAKTGNRTGRKVSTRCAIYTRKSHEEGLEQDFNSLDAQRESCEAYVESQKHEGWTCLPEMYDDAGISGATMERPAPTSTWRPTSRPPSARGCKWRPAWSVDGLAVEDWVGGDCGRARAVTITATAAHPIRSNTRPGSIAGPR